MNDLFINIIEDSSYPSSHYYFNPDTKYPEYLWDDSDISKERNYIYEMVRNCLIGLKMDANNFNTKNWNPFGEFINLGDTVVIKPNWVMHFNKNKHVTENGLECLITHPSIVRAVTDYCLIALKGTGRIIIGDAPMQGCDLDQLIEKSGYQELFYFFNRHSCNIVPTDFRQYSSKVDKNKILTGKKYNTSKGLEVELGTMSRLHNTKSESKGYKVSDYNQKITNSYHHIGKHAYLISNEVLSAEVLINLCKPKCHRLAGITAAVKNIVGITFEKACLPHRTTGSKQQGGDEYLHNSIIKKIIGKVLDRKIAYEDHGNYNLSLVMRYTYGLLYHFMRVLSKDPFILGSWYGNDTIWRTVLDLYEILLYADKTGSLKEHKQRKIFNLADMIISGERNGPVAPEPKKLGVLLAGIDAVFMDRLICQIMGFDYTKVPSVYHAISDPKLTGQEIGSHLVHSNLTEYNNKKSNELIFPQRWSFKPYDTWKGYVEKSECT